MLTVSVCVGFSLHIDPGAMVPVISIYGYVSMFLYHIGLYFDILYVSLLSHSRFQVF